MILYTIIEFFHSLSLKLYHMKLEHLMIVKETTE